jgi:DNA-binding response OmpR family regulator
MARVLLVEDHDGIHRMLCDALVHQGHQADCVKTKAEAEQALASNPYALVIANIVLPDGSGSDIAHVAEQRGARTILMTGHPDESQALHVQEIAHLQKPFSLDDFEKMVRDRLGA